MRGGADWLLGCLLCMTGGCLATGIAETPNGSSGDGGINLNGSNLAELPWGGSQLHWKSDGFADRLPMRLEVQGEDAADTSMLWCLREYDLDQNGKATFTGVEINLVYGDMTYVMDFEADHWAPLPNALPSPLKLKIVADDDQALNEGEGKLTLKTWKTADGEESRLKTKSEVGALTIHQWSGTVGADGLIPDTDGTVGGVATIRFLPTGDLTLSFTAQCTRSEVDPYEPPAP
jgi:hypothetical protein